MVGKIRLAIQHLSFLIFMYGGRIGINLGNAVPCFACPYVAGCGGYCYLMALQRSGVGLRVTFEYLFSAAAINILWPFLIFLLLFIPLSKLWCGWLCPFCLFQDWITMIRKKLGIREMVISQSVRKGIKPVKYVLLGLMVIISLSIANFGLHPDWSLPFCQICPGRILLPMFVGDFSHLSLDFTNAVTLSFTAVAIIITAGMLVGMFFKERFFCMFCPMLALMSLFSFLSPVKFVKSGSSCLACGNCQRSCPIDIRDVHLERESKSVLTQDCMACMKCVESCPGDDVLTFRWGWLNIFRSSKSYVARKWDRLTK